MNRPLLVTSYSNTAFPVAAYIPQFDGLRGLSILAVIFAHSGFLRALPHASFLEYGRVGVELFFVLSGFLITGIFLDTRTSTHYFRNFYARKEMQIGVAVLVMEGPYAKLQVSW
jgi:peptidoglycan/LPS O-acetylase OafA/YrhL